MIYDHGDIAGSVTCADIEMMGDPTALTSTDISDLSTSTFEDCADTLGSSSTWDTTQLSALATKAKDVS